MRILAIESSCDETAASILEADSFEQKLLSNVVVSQIDIFKSYGGVIPEVAARSHLEAILPVLDKAFSDANLTKDGENDWDKIDAIAVTHTPGLLGSLLIGTLTARTLAILHNKPLYPIHHLKSHIYSNWLTLENNKSSGRLEQTNSEHKEATPTVEPSSKQAPGCGVPGPVEDMTRGALNLSVPTFPLLALVISGGHTQIIYMPSHNSFEIIGTTLDDAVGECFDKVAKILGLPYPGGPSIASAAKSGNPEKYKLPHPKIDALDFSFSGLKTAVLRAVQKEVGVPISYPSHDLKKFLSGQQVADFAASFEKTACEILLEKLQLALKTHPETRSIVFAGGVSANNRLRELASKKLSRENIYFPPLCFSGDNAAMVAMAAFYEIESGVSPTDPYSLNISPRSVIQ